MSNAVENNHAWLIERALAEDVGSGDITSLYFIPERARATALLVARSEGVIAGTAIAAAVFQRVDAEIEIHVLLDDGARVAPGAVIMKVEGPARSLLTAERTALNFMQRLSGIATQTHRYVEAIEASRAKILDTRKTTPGWRALEKAAVVAGGGTNHRMGLFDRAMLKDNHLATFSDLPALRQAMQRLKQERPEVSIQVEADRLDQVAEFLDIEEIDAILLDNMSLSELSSAVAMRGARGRPTLEASGGVTLQSVAAIAATGVDYISVGALTHSVVALDIALDFITPSGT